MRSVRMVLAAAAVMALGGAAQAAVLVQDDFNSATYTEGGSIVKSGANALPVNPNSQWGAIGAVGGSWTAAAAAAAESPFTATPGGRGAVVTDNSITYGASGAIQSPTFTAQTGHVYASFDYKPMSVGTNDNRIAFQTSGFRSDGVTASSGAVVNLICSTAVAPTTFSSLTGMYFGYTDNQNRNIGLQAITYDTWYQVTIDADLTGTYPFTTLTITPFGGTTTAFDPVIFNQINQKRINQITVGNMTGPTQEGGYAIDNITVSNSVPEPASLSLLGVGGLMMLRRRR